MCQGFTNSRYVHDLKGNKKVDISIPSHMTSQKAAACSSHTYFLKARNNEKVHLPVITVLSTRSKALARDKEGGGGEREEERKRGETTGKERSHDPWVHVT